MKIKLNKLLKKGKTLFLADDQGLEHGPADFNEKNIDPNSIIQIAKKGKFNGIVFQKGIAEKYQEEIKKSKIPLIIKRKSKKDLMAYAARTGLETGADIVKINYNQNPKDLAWAVKSAGKTKVVIAGGTKKGEVELLKQAKEIIDSGAIGLAIGRNVWQHEKPLEITK